MRTLTWIAVAVAAAAALTATAGLAQPAGTTMVRGKVASVEGDVVTVKGADKTYVVHMAPNWAVQVLKPITMDGIKEGSFIGTAEMPQADGTGRSLEVHVFPPGVKMGEGHYGWDLKPGSMMTNGTVGRVAKKGKGRQLEVNYTSGTRTIVVPPKTPIVEYGNGVKTQIKPGVAVFIVARNGPQGDLAANAVSIGDKGAKPAM
ncbi:MAG: hypothetical protein JWM47_4353 [Acidimicrobiales bacterium]|nr:hypothetical protein [Acidimicrobiales bacterium]